MSLQPSLRLGKLDYFNNDSIASLSTREAGAVVVVRLSGEEARRVSLLLVEKGERVLKSPRKLILSKLRSIDGKLLDEALVVFFPKPDSYTGEDIIEFHIHGGMIQPRKIMEAIYTAGLRQALPGEFSFRAVKNGKMSLSQAVAVSDLTQAINDSAAQNALERLLGGGEEAYLKVSQKLKELLVLSEAEIDFADQGVAIGDLGYFHKEARLIAKELLTWVENQKKTQLLQNGIKVAFFGEPNSGKSSLFNTILGTQRAIVSTVAGTTRDVVSELINLRSKEQELTFRLLDLAGFRDTSDPLERAGVDRAKHAAAEAEIVILLIDLTRGPNEAQKIILELEQARRQDQQSPIVVFTKADLVEKNIHKIVGSLNQNFGFKNVITTSSQTRQGIPDLIDRLLVVGRELVAFNPDGMVLTQIELIEEIQSAKRHLDRAAQAQSFDLFVADVRQAITAISRASGELTTEDLLGQIFQRFCIGK